MYRNVHISFSDRLGEPSLVLILKWGGELTPAGRIQAEELGRIFRCMYPGGQGRHLSGSYLMFICLPCSLLSFYTVYRRLFFYNNFPLLAEFDLGLYP